MKLKSIAANQTEVTVGENKMFFSYETPVAAIVDGQVYRTAQHYSVTTSRHINKWLAGRTAIEKPQSFFDGLIETARTVRLITIL